MTGTYWNCDDSRYDWLERHFFILFPFILLPTSRQRRCFERLCVSRYRSFPAWPAAPAYRGCSGTTRPRRTGFAPQHARRTQLAVTAGNWPIQLTSAISPQPLRFPIINHTIEVYVMRQQRGRCQFNTSRHQISIVVHHTKSFSRTYIAFWHTVWRIRIRQ